MGRRIAALLVAATLMGVTTGPGALGGDARAQVKRAMPDYDGRGDEATDAGDVLIWVPRIVFSPAYVVSEYLLRRPIGYVLTEIERNDVIGVLSELFTFGDDAQGGIVPTLALDFGLEVGFLPSFGFYFFWNDVGADGNDVRLRAAFGGNDWVQVRLADRVSIGDDDEHRVSFFGRFDRRKDWVFAGIGGGFGDDVLARYGEQEWEGGIRYEMKLGERGFFHLQGTVIDSTFFTGGCCDDSTIQQKIDDGAYNAPPGFRDGFFVYEVGLDVAYDTRGKRPGNESGLRAQLYGGLDFDLGDARGLGWGRYGAAVGGFWDFWQHRTLGLIVRTELVDPLSKTTDVPFTALTMLGGDEAMGGFVEGRLRDRSAFTMMLDYRWPVWTWLDGWLYASVGNVFGEHYEGFAFDDMRSSFGIGMRTADESDHPFQFLVAAGTEPFSQGGEVTNVRFVFGTTSGF